jgi:hypothetical protein
MRELPLKTNFVAFAHKAGVPYGALNVAFPLKTSFSQDWYMAGASYAASVSRYT